MRRCDLDGCDRPHNARGLCKRHYYRVYRDPNFTPMQVHPRKERYCDVAGCDRPHHSRGWCATHYMRWRKNRDVMADVPIAMSQFLPDVRSPNARPFDLDDTGEL